jgi:hypothetical protein
VMADESGGLGYVPVVGFCSKSSGSMNIYAVRWVRLA